MLGTSAVAVWQISRTGGPSPGGVSLLKDRLPGLAGFSVGALCQEGRSTSVLAAGKKTWEVSPCPLRATETEDNKMLTKWFQSTFG
jgi:hypothetical protein